MSTPSRRLDAPGLACLDLTPLISSTMRELEPGQLLEVHADDPAARVGVPAWCRLTRNPLVHEGRPDPAHPDQTVFHIAKHDPQQRASKP